MSSDTGLRVDRVDARGVWAHGGDHLEDLVLDVLFDDRRVWSSWLLRDSERRAAIVACFERLHRQLRGDDNAPAGERAAQAIAELFDAAPPASPGAATGR